MLHPLRACSTQIQPRARYAKIGARPRRRLNTAQRCAGVPFRALRRSGDHRQASLVFGMSSGAHSPDSEAVAALIRAHRARPWLVAHVSSNVWLCASDDLIELCEIESFPWRVEDHRPDQAAIWKEVNVRGLQHGFAAGVSPGPTGIPFWCEWQVSRLDDEHVFSTGGPWDPIPSLRARWPALSDGALRGLAAVTALMGPRGEEVPVSLDDLAAATGRSRRSIQRDLQALRLSRVLELEPGRASAPWLYEFCESHARVLPPGDDELRITSHPEG